MKTNEKDQDKINTIAKIKKQKRLHKKTHKEEKTKTKETDKSQIEIPKSPKKKRTMELSQIGS